ncbi:protein IQ-DOMAIN 1-like isoform X1 [Panicum virgatum]|uniref:IQ calmodulin-binding motif family protein n=2 Tax=Panicum virgatum TaxID=38727 RepID=A0A8T0TRV8_PANVG|nr:protein IQ-DOMAIN 1-like isoform X1 [Panicum virgatum]KAG2612787.1 hypothetical protein PVAP13_4KG308200 [Panicum virgatum]
MGLTGGIVRRVFSKSPCSSAGSGGSRPHSEKGAGAHQRRWSSLRLYLCGEDMNTAPEDDDNETVSVKSFETCAMPLPQPQEEHVPAAVAPQPSGGVHDGDDSTGEPPEDQRVPAGHSHAITPTEPDEKEGAAAMLIQSAFRGFMARRELRELRIRRETDGGGAGEPKSPTSASVATSVVVQVGESLSNLRLSDDSASVQQRGSQKSRPPPPAAFRVKEEWDDSTVSSNVSRMRIQSRIAATTRRERALAYAFSQQLRSGGGGGTRKRLARPDQAEFNVGWSWLERWMATRQGEPAADDCMSRNADAGSAGRRVVVVRRRGNLAGEEKESCGSNDVSVVSFDGSSSLGGRSGLSCHKPGRSRLKGARGLPRRKAAASDHRHQARSHKVSKKGHQRQEQAPTHKDQAEADGYDASCQPPTDY